MLRSALVLVLAAAPWALAQEKAAEVRLQSVSYDGLKEAILKQRGKVVYVDFWFYNCVPCKVAMPHLVDLYAKRQPEGLEIITVNINVEEMPEKENFDKSLEFLRSKKAVFQNFVLAEKEIPKQLKIASFPTIYLFDREGRWVHFTGVFDKKNVEQTLDKMLREKK